ncbi:hypothetical protein [Mycoplasma procyoni]|uniref:hypothetical protein n=1 Tax=Mycoplasma procyoni TaxID=568784 RepID=UPI00197BAFE3|nr:hypothetical protein [Mycoplasma procyoni]MBN3534358.1 hypothetical protein [Mycoplasma procyoni]
MIEELRRQILEKISSIPGVYGFSEIDYSDQNESQVLAKEDWDKSIVIMDGINGLKINLGIILVFSANARTVIEEIRSLLDFYLQQNKLKLGTLNVQVKGVKI